MPRGLKLDAEGVLHFIKQRFLRGMEGGEEKYQKRGWNIEDFTE